MDLPRELSQLLTGRQLDSVSLGESGATVWRCTKPGHATWYLKATTLSGQLGLERESSCLRWMREVGLPVPVVLDYRQSTDAEFLLSEAAAGTSASDSSWHDDAERVATALGRGLARLHSLDVSNCPFDRRTTRQLDEARAHIAAGTVREDDFDAARLGRSATELFTELLTMIPPDEELVFVHGDFCLPNVFVADVGEGLQLTGLVDCGRAGVGDRHQDLALAIRSLTYNFDADAIPHFLHAYGGRPADARRLEFFTILDEFF